jgi:hypothetical protein
VSGTTADGVRETSSSSAPVRPDTPPPSAPPALSRGRSSSAQHLRRRFAGHHDRGHRNPERDPSCDASWQSWQSPRVVVTWVTDKAAAMRTIRAASTL